jgi:uncharacterized protein YajQ (UPF0234 family)
MQRRILKLKKIIIIILTIMPIIISPLSHTSVQAETASKYIKITEFAKELLSELGLQPSVKVDGIDGHINQLKNIGVIKDVDFKSYNGYLTRGDMLIILNRADKYLNKTEISEKLIEKIIDMRISDIKSVKKAKRIDIAEGFARGFLKGFSNGYYITNRNLKLTSKVTREAAINCIKMLKDTSLRVKLSPDGQLIRTTNLPKNADKYEYILAAYPNEFYEKPFEFVFYNDYEKYKDKDVYLYPVEMRSKTFRNWYEEWPLSEVMDKYLYDWADRAERYLQYIFNVDYRTINDDWIKGLTSVYAHSNIECEEHIRKYYLDYMKSNKVIIESTIIAVEPSTLYKDDDYCMRAYVKYRITAKDMNVSHNRLIYAAYPYFRNLKSGEWRTGIYDIRFSTNDAFYGDGSDFVIDFLTRIDDSLNVPID